MIQKKEESYVKWFSELSNKDVPIAGGKGASLAEMYNSKFPVPPGFVITAQAYQFLIEKSGVKERISSLLSDLDIENTNDLNEKSKRIRELISNAQMPKELADEITEAYDILDVDKQRIKTANTGAMEILKMGHEPPFVAVRSSATTEDLESISENEHVLLEINGNTIYEKIKDIYEKFGDCNNYNVRIPAMNENKIEWMPIKSLLKHSTTKSKLYKIKTITGREITISPNHTLISLDETNLQPVVTNIKQIKKGTKIPVIGLIPEVNNERPIVVLDYVKGKDVIEKNDRIMIINKSNNWNIQNGMPKEIEVSKEFAYFLGLYISEGSTYGNGVSVTNYNYGLLEKVENFCRKLGIYEKNIINKGSVRIYSPAFVRFLHETCGKPNENKKGKGKICSEKRVPNFVFGWSKKNIGSFLRGCFDGDGTVGKSISYTTTSRMLGGGMLKLLEILGTGFYFNIKNNVFKIAIPLKESIKFSELINFDDIGKKQKLVSLIKEYESREKHPEFKYNLVINDALSAQIKNCVDEKMPKKEVEVALCSVCKNEMEQTSYYDGKKRHYCRICKKAFYDNQVEKKLIEKQDYFDNKGRFKRESKPWNYGNIQGKLSLNELERAKDKYDLKDKFSIFEGTVKWEEIKEISAVQNTGEVYDFSVPKIENFAAGLGGIITHNSASFAGQQETFLNVKGTAMLLKRVKDCCASLFTARAVYYRTKKGFDHSKSYLAVVVQRMVDADKSGVMFSQNPVSRSNTIVIESVWGLGEGIVSGQIKPDNYVIDGNLDEFKILETKVADKKIAIIKTSSGQNEVTKLTSERSKQQVLTTYEIKILAQYAKQLENHYSKPQDIEFAIEGKEIFIVQSRPITTIATEKTEEIKGKILLSGLGASPGVSSGPVRIIKDMKDLDKIKKGDVLVTEMTNPDMVVAMQKSTGIITDEGGVTSHAAIVSREMGIPAVVGTNEATKILKDGEIVTVDGNHGKVFEGKAEKQEVVILPIVPTKIKIKVIVDLPDYASRAVKSGAKAVGLTRLEGIIAESGNHPLKYVKEKKIGDYVVVLFKGLKKIAEHFEEIWVRSSDIRSDEYQHLEGAPKQVEGNPMLGDHGIRFSLKHLDIFKAEITAIKKLAEHFPDKIIGLMAPQIINVEEVRKIKEIAAEIIMPKNVKIGIMVETPAAVQVINSLCEEGINFVSFGTNDLTQFTLALDRNNTEVQHLYNEMNPAVLNSIAYVIRRCKKYGVETSICGQAASREDMAQFLFTQGIDSISVNADAAYKVSKLIAELESGTMQAPVVKKILIKTDSTLESDLIKVEKVVREVPHIKHLKNELAMPQPPEAKIEAQSEPPIKEPAILTLTTPITNVTVQPAQALAPAIDPPIEETKDEKEQDIEDIVLQQLDDDYEPGNENNSNKDNIPPLNDAIPIDSEHLEEEEKEEEIDLSQEWKGEKRRQ